MASASTADWQKGHKTRLKLAFCLYKYFPYGGLQRDFLRIARECQALGHDIRVYTLVWHGEIPEGFDVILVPVEALTNHSRYERYHVWVQSSLIRDPVDAVIGINKMPGLDVYYAADSCYEEKAQTQRSWLYRQLPRYRHFSRSERAVFGKESATEILMISEVQKPFFNRHYETQSDRISFLPPGISRSRVAPRDVLQRRTLMRNKIGIAADEKMVVMIGSGFAKKGLARALFALRSLPREQRLKTRFIVIGEDDPRRYRLLATILGIRNLVTIMAGQDRIEQFLFAADLMLLPALDEAAGIVILESIVAGLPVLVTENCGYAHYVKKAGAGEVLSMPFKQRNLNLRLATMLLDNRRTHWFEVGRKFAAHADIYSLHRQAAKKVEEVALARIDQQATSPNVIAFCLFKYFPFGGLQRDFMRIALEAQKLGYRVRVYTLLWQGDIPEGFEVIIVPASAITNHSRYRLYYEWVSEHLSHWPAGAVVGFNKMPGLDIYYAADSCYEDKARNQRSLFYRALPRYEMFSRFEKAVFGRSSATEILMISPVQVPLFEKYYETQRRRLHLLSPGIDRDRIAPSDRKEIRHAFRREMDINEGQLLLLMIGSGFITKGLDRALTAVAALPTELRSRTRMIIIGQDSPRRFLRMAKRLGVSERLVFLKGRDDIPRFLLGADLLLHPAYIENTGTVLLESVVAGLPVLATDVCGYAHYIEEAGAGRLIPSPFKQETFNVLLQSMLLSEERQAWSENGIAFSRHADIYDMPKRAAEFIDKAINS